MLASELYALSQGSICAGSFECHWCSSPCTADHIHDDLPTHIPFVRSPHPSKRPGNPYICQGCWLYRRTRLTVNYLSGEWLDRQKPFDHSWLITKTNAWGIRPDDYPELFRFLLKPQCSFVLSLRTPDYQFHNYLQLALCNDIAEITANTTLYFTVNNSANSYTIYELEEAIRNDEEGKSPGVRTLLAMHRPPRPTEMNQHRGRGRPRKEEEVDHRTVERAVRMSGLMTTGKARV
jgi:hypothetical protein